jgi:phenylacetate-coenzyme A ligase PaaK-like adenylate-forming protein
MAEEIERLEEAIGRARQSRFYRDRIVGHPVRSLDDLRRLPFTRRSDLEAAGLDGLLAVPRSRLWQYHESSGSTGRPVSTWYTERDRDIALVALKRLPIALGPGVLLLNRLPYAFVALSHFLEAWVRETGAAIAPAGNLNWTVPFPRAIDLIARLRPQMIACLPFELLILRELVPEVGTRGSELNSLETVLTAGGLLPPALRRLIERDWGAKVRNVYGSTEALGLGSECSAGRMHLHTDLFVCEIVERRSLAPLDEGEREGIFVLTSLAQEAMPLVRYVTDDVVRVSEAPCSCGSPHPTIEVLGRAGEMLEYGGHVLSPYDLLDAAYDFATDHGGRILFVVGLSAGLRAAGRIAPLACGLRTGEPGAAAHTARCRGRRRPGPARRVATAPASSRDAARLQAGDGQRLAYRPPSALHAR